MNKLRIRSRRRCILLTHACLLAYDKGVDIIAADEGLIWRMSHRGCSRQMDAVFDKQYFPFRRVAAEEKVILHNIEEFGDVIETILLLWVHSEIAAYEETVKATFAVTKTMIKSTMK